MVTSSNGTGGGGGSVRVASAGIVSKINIANVFKLKVNAYQVNIITYNETSRCIDFSFCCSLGCRLFL